MSTLLTVVLALLAGVGIGYLIFQDVERRKNGGKTAAELRQEHEEYREEVQQHFTKTSDLFQSVTMQYRELYDHLSQGAQSLCESIPPSPALELSDKALLPHKTTSEEPRQGRANTETTTLSGSADDDVPVAGGDTQQDDDTMGADAGVAVNTKPNAESDIGSEGPDSTAKDKRTSSG